MVKCRFKLEPRPWATATPCFKSLRWATFPQFAVRSPPTGNWNGEGNGNVQDNRFFTGVLTYLNTHLHDYRVLDPVCYSVAAPSICSHQQVATPLSTLASANGYRKMYLSQCSCRLARLGPQWVSGHSTLVCSRDLITRIPTCQHGGEETHSYFVARWPSIPGQHQSIRLVLYLPLKHRIHVMWWHSTRRI